MPRPPLFGPDVTLGITGHARRRFQERARPGIGFKRALAEAVDVTDRFPPQMRKRAAYLLSEAANVIFVVTRAGPEEKRADSIVKTVLHRVLIFNRGNHA